MQKVASKAMFMVKKLSEKATLPVKGSEGAAGYDLFAAEDCVVPANGKYLVKTGLAMAIPTGNYGRMAPRSGLALKHHINVGAGVIDEDYRGEVGVLLFNHGQNDFVVKHGDRVAQLIIEVVVPTEVVQVEELEATARGAGGFGSTGFGKAVQQHDLSTNPLLEEQAKFSSVPGKRAMLEDFATRKTIQAELHEENIISVAEEVATVRREVCILKAFDLFQENKLSFLEHNKLCRLIFTTQDCTEVLETITKYENDVTALKEALSL